MIIYLAKNKINKKVYVGQTIQKLERRIAQHKHLSKKNKSNSYFHNALKNYGFENFDWFILKQCECQEYLNKSEKEFISYFKSNLKENGYNLTDGGEHPIFNEETKRKMSISAKKRCTDVHIERFVKNMKSVKFRKRKDVSWNKNPRFIEIDENKLIKMYNDNILIPNIAEYFGVGVGTIRRRIFKIGLKRKKVATEEFKSKINNQKENNPRWNDNINLDKVKELIEKGYSYYQASNKLGYPPTTVKRRLSYEIRP